MPKQSSFVLDAGTLCLADLLAAGRLDVQFTSFGDRFVSFGDRFVWGSPNPAFEFHGAPSLDIEFHGSDSQRHIATPMNFAGAPLARHTPVREISQFGIFFNFVGFRGSPIPRTGNKHNSTGAL